MLLPCTLKACTLLNLHSPGVEAVALVFVPILTSIVRAEALRD